MPDDDVYSRQLSYLCAQLSEQLRVVTRCALPHLCLYVKHQQIWPLMDVGRR